VLVVGAPRSGKTAVLAELVRQLRAHGDRDVVVRFIGATPRSVQVRTLTQDLTASLRQRREGGDPHPPLGTRECDTLSSHSTWMQTIIIASHCVGLTLPRILAGTANYLRTIRRHDQTAATPVACNAFGRRA
jgi:hypothetical protein